MIASVSHGTGFGGLASYLLRGRDGRQGDRVAWTAVRNLPTERPELAAPVMRATSELSERIEKSVYHLSLSAAPGEELTQEQWERVADRVLDRLGLERHQVLLVAHRDTEHQHLHLMVNRVELETGKVWSPWRDYVRIERALRGLERELELREVPGRHGRLSGQEPPDRVPGRTSGERREVERTGREVVSDLWRRRVGTVIQEAKSWAELEAGLAERGLSVEAKGRGLVVTDGERQVKASRIARAASRGKLEERFGQGFAEWRAERRELLSAAERFERVGRRRDDLARRLDVAGNESREYWLRVQAVKQQRAATAGERRWLAAEVGRLYRPEAAREAGWKIARDVRREGWERAAERLEREPERYGPVRRRTLVERLRRERAPVTTPERSARVLRELGRIHGAGEVLREAVRERRSRGLRARRLAHAIARKFKRSPLPYSAELELAKVAVRIGIEAARLVLAPTPMRAASAALRMGRALSRVLGREMDRGMER